MNAKDAILKSYATGDRFVSSYLEDLNDADLLVRPVSGQNHIAWQLGHLILSERGMAEAIKPGSSPELPPGFVEAHGRDAASTTSDDPSRFQTKAKYQELMKAQREATLSVLNSLSEAELDAPSPERFQRMAPKAGDVMLLVGSHAMIHVGQFVGVRRKLNKPVAI